MQKGTRIMKKFIPLLLSVFLIMSCSGHDVDRYRNGITVDLDKTLSGGVQSLHVKVLADDIIHVFAAPGDVIKTPISLCVEEKEWPRTNFSVSKYGDWVQLTTAKLQLEISLPSGDITYRDRSGNLILQENGRSLKPVTTVIDTGVSTKQHLRFQENEAIYGLGQFTDGVLNWRGQVAELMQENTVTAIPMFVSTKGYGILWDNYSFTKFVDKQQTYISSEMGDGVNYYFFYGPSMDEAIAGYREVTGTAPMFPKWAYGYTQSRENYKTQDDVLDAVREFRRRQIPLDVIIKDWAYWEEDWWGQKTLRKDYFPDATRMVQEIHEIHNVHTMISIWPNMEIESPDFKEFMSQDSSYYFLWDPSLEEWPFIVYNAFNEDARELYWSQIERGILVHGFDGLWCDSSEPEPGWVDNDKDRHEVRFNSGLVSGKRYMNAYPLMHSKGIYENWRKSDLKSRVVNLTRSGFVGQQRYGTICWSGDIGASWDVLRTQIPAGLNFSMAGMPYWGNDIGAFFIEPEHANYFGGGDYPDGPGDDGYKELYVRWMQFGTFCPQMRSHGTHYPREPWRFGDEGDWAYEAILRMINLRYRLMPYIYSLAHMVTAEHYTIMRGLAMDFQHDVLVYDIDDQYMFGPAIMANPVVEAGARSRAIYLPEGDGWYSFWKGNYHSGGQTIVVETEMDEIPLFVKAGSILPIGPDMQYATEKTDPIEIRVYEGADGEFVLYEDENDTYNYEEGKFSKIRFSWDDSAKQLTIAAREGEYSGMNSDHQFNIVLYKRSALLYSWMELDISAGLELSEEPDSVVDYSGKQLVIDLSG
jgi:alpha-D-xyloside xylohydrolase